jgi:chromosome partitioning protein
MPRIQAVSRKMTIVTIASSKGGTGKSTATVTLAAKAVQNENNVALLDLNYDQASLTQWWTVRGGPDNPQLYDCEDLNLQIDLIAHDGFDLLLIDTSPADIDLVEQAVIKSDAVVVPVRASLFDVGAVAPIVEICKERWKPFGFLLNAVDGRSQWRGITQSAIEALAEMGPILKTKLVYHPAYVNAATLGKAGFETTAVLQPEADALWAEVKRLCASRVTPTRRQAAHG